MLGSLGEIRLWPDSRIPNNWMLCNGQLLPVSLNQDLFELIGNTFGGNGSSNFALPNLAPLPTTQPSSPGVRYIICVNGPWALEGGMEGMYAEIRLWPSSQIPEGWTLCNGQILNLNTENLALYSLMGNAYGGDGVNNFALPKVAPQGAVNYLISLSGVFPRRSDDDDSTPVDCCYSEIRLWAGAFEPAGFALLTNPRSYRVPTGSVETTTAEILYSLLENNYGGIFPVFQLPQLAPLPAGPFGSTVSYIMATSGYYPDFP